MALADLLLDGTAVDNTESKVGGSTCHEVMDDPVGSPDDDTTYARVGSAGGNLIGFICTTKNMPGPSVISGITVKWRHRLESGVTQTTRAVLRINGVDYVNPAGITSSSTSYIDSEQSYSVNPATGQPFQRSEIDVIQIGVQQDQEGTTFHRYTALRLTVDYQAAAVINETARDAGSRRLWLYGHPVPRLTIDVPLYEALALDPGTKVRVEHIAGLNVTGDGWLAKPWQARLFEVEAVDITPGAPSARVRLIDMQRLLCVFMDKAQCERTPGDFADGVARFNKGAATRTYARAQTETSGATYPHPVSGFHVRPGANIERLSAAGAGVSNGEFFEPYEENSVYVSSLHAGEFIGWTKNGDGVNGSAITADTGDVGLWDSSTLVLQSARFLAGTTHTTDLYLSQSLNGGANYAANTKLWPSFLHRTNTGTGGANALCWALQRTNGNWWTNSSQTWGASLVWNQFGDTGGNVAAFFGNQIDVGASATALTLRIGLPSGGTSGRISHLFHAQFGIALHHTTRIISGLSTGIREADDLRLSNNSTARTLNLRGAGGGTEEGGAFVFEFVSSWSSADIGNAFPGFWGCTFDANNKIGVYYDGVADAFKFYWEGGGTTNEASVAATVARGDTFRIAVRWIGAQQEHGLPSMTLDIWQNGVKGTSALGTAISETASAELRLGTFDGGGFAGGRIRNFHSYQWAPPDAIMARLPLI